MKYMDTKQLLNLIKYNAKMELTDLASALNECEADVSETLKELENIKLFAVIIH